VLGAGGGVNEEEDEDEDEDEDDEAVVVVDEVEMSCRISDSCKISSSLFFVVIIIPLSGDWSNAELEDEEELL